MDEYTINDLGALEALQTADDDGTVLTLDDNDIALLLDRFDELTR